MLEKEYESKRKRGGRRIRSELQGADALLHYLCDGDVTKVPAVEESDVEMVLEFFYVGRIKYANELSELIESMKD